MVPTCPKGELEIPSYLHPVYGFQNKREGLQRRRNWIVIWLIYAFRSWSYIGFQKTWGFKKWGPHCRFYQFRRISSGRGRSWRGYYLQMLSMVLFRRPVKNMRCPVEYHVTHSYFGAVRHASRKILCHTWLGLPNIFFLLKNSARYFFLTRSICSMFFRGGFAQPPHQKSNSPTISLALVVVLFTRALCKQHGSIHF